MAMSQVQRPSHWTPITTKLHRPGVTAHLVARPRLFAQLDRGLACPLTLVCAGAGYGKTTLVSAWIEQMAAASDGAPPRRPAAWLSLDEYDSDLTTFVRYFCAALRTIFPEPCSQTLALLQAPQPPPVAALVAILTNEIESLPEDFNLVLDDFHTIDSVEVADLFSGLARHWPRHLHLVLITRHSPLLPLASLRAKGALAEIRTRDLQLTTPELAQYVTSMLGRPPTDAVVSSLERHTEGWFVGLHLATLSLAGDVDAARLDALRESDANVADYLVDELLAHQPPDVMTFLLKTSLLSRFCVPLCDHLMDEAGSARDARACLDWLERANLLVVPLDDRREWYRYHHLLQDLLRVRAAAEFGAEQVISLRRRAAAWFAGQGLTDDALQHALAAHDLGLAAELMEQGLCDLLNRDDAPTLRRWMGLLPEDLRLRRPGLLMIEAWMAHFSWRLPKLSEVLQQLETLVAEDAGTLAAEQLRVLRGNMLALHGQEAHFRNQPDRALAYVQEALTLIPEPWTYVRGGCILYLGLKLSSPRPGRCRQSVVVGALRNGARQKRSLCPAHPDGALFQHVSGRPAGASPADRRVDASASPTRQ
jgi:LuxR family maltose regulon positive regulatory protein